MLTMLQYNWPGRSYFTTYCIDFFTALQRKPPLSDEPNIILESRKDLPCPTYLTIKTFQMHIRSAGKNSPVLNDSCAEVR